MDPISIASASASSRDSSGLIVSGYSTSCFGGSGAAMVSFANVNESKSGNARSFFTAFEDDNNDEGYEHEEYLNKAGKKRRLSIDQVRFLERSFEVDNKLEPDRKSQLGKELGLQPRQVAIWFQNRRARWKTRQMEKDYDTLQASYNILKSSYDTLVKENENLKIEVIMLTEKLVSKDIPLPSAGLLETIKQFASLSDNHISSTSPEAKDSKIQLVEQKLDDFTSAKSDIFQSDSPAHIANGVYSPHHLAHVDSPYIFQPDCNNSDLSRDEEDTLPNAYLPSLLPEITSHEDHQPLWSWSL